MDLKKDINILKKKTYMIHLNSQRRGKMGENKPIDLKMTGLFRLQKEGISIDGVDLSVIFKRFEGRQVYIHLKTAEID